MLNKKPIVIEKYADNGEHLHYDLIDSETGEIVWSEGVDQEIEAFT